MKKVLVYCFKKNQLDNTVHAGEYNVNLKNDHIGGKTIMDKFKFTLSEQSSIAMILLLNHAIPFIIFPFSQRPIPFIIFFYFTISNLILKYKLQQLSRN